MSHVPRPNVFAMLDRHDVSQPSRAQHSIEDLEERCEAEDVTDVKLARGVRRGSNESGATWECVGHWLFG
jgi:hypothetical protein